jgi:phosphomannomutase
MQVSPDILKAYDIRGVVPEALHPDITQAFGRAFRSRAVTEEETVVVGRDGRRSSGELASVFMHGLRQATETGSPAAALVETRGALREVNVLNDDVQGIVGEVKLARPSKVVNSGHGVAGASALQLFHALGCSVIEPFSEVDSNFLNHHPDSSNSDDLCDLIVALQTIGADLGLAFDGDGNRLGIFTPRGQNISAQAEVNTIDGLHVDRPDGFGLIRASNNTPLLLLRFAWQTPQALQRIENEILALLHLVKPDA